MGICAGPTTKNKHAAFLEMGAPEITMQKMLSAGLELHPPHGTLCTA